MRSSKVLILLAFICAMLNGVIAPLQALQAALVKDIYGRGSEALSLIDGCLSAGTLMGAFCYPLLAGRISVDKALLICGILNGGFYFALVGAAGISGFPLAFYGVLGIACLVFGLAVGFLNTTLSVLMMKVIPAEYMARESALVGAVSIGAIPLTSSLVSVAAVRVSVPVILACFGGITILLVTGLRVSGKLNCLREIKNEDKREEGMQLD